MRRKNTTSYMMKTYIAEGLLLLLEGNAYEEISIHEITDRAGVNRSTYYRNFSSKENIIRFYYESLLTEFQTLSNNRPHITLKSYLHCMFTFFAEHKKQLMLLYEQKLSYLLLDTLNEVFIHNTSNDDFSSQFSVYYHTGGIFNTFLLWFKNDMKQSPETMTNIAISLLPDNFSPMLMNT